MKITIKYFIKHNAVFRTENDLPQSVKSVLLAPLTLKQLIRFKIIYVKKTEA